MARIKWISERLKRWGAWRARKESNGLGYARSSIFLSAPSSGSWCAEIPINDLEAAQTDRAVESLRFSKSHLHLALVLIYVNNTGIRTAARKMARAESTIKSNLEDADHALAEWFERQSNPYQHTPPETKNGKGTGSFTP